jgi:hypothetical protein
MQRIIALIIAPLFPNSCQPSRFVVMPPHDIMSESTTTDRQPVTVDSQLDPADSQNTIDLDLLKEVQKMEDITRDQDARHKIRQQLQLIGSLNLQQAQTVLAILSPIPDVEAVHTQFPTLSVIQQITDQIKKRFPHIASDQSAVNAYAASFMQRMKERKEKEDRQQLMAEKAKRKAEEETDDRNFKRKKVGGKGGGMVKAKE